MANIKFSAFTQKVASADVEFLVGYTGGDNVRITPSVFDDRYLPLAGGTMTGTTRHGDDVVSYWGAGDDLKIYHEGTDSIIQNYTGSIYIDNNADNQDIVFRCDNGSGGIENYIQIDGSEGRTLFNKHIRVNDGVQIQVGNDADLQIYHDGSNSYIDSTGAGDLYIRCGSDDESIIFQNDDGSGGLETYFELQGVSGGGSPFTVFPDNSNLVLGAGHDMRMYHNGSGSYVDNYTGVLQFTNYTDDSDIIFKSDNGSGGVTEYFRLDGSQTILDVAVRTLFRDNVRATFGAGYDLQIYHDGSNSFIDDSGTGDLRIRSNFLKIEKYTGETMATFNDDNSVALYFNNSVKFETTNTGVKITGVNQYADNAAALAGGLTVGDVYRTGDLLKIVN